MKERILKMLKAKANEKREKALTGDFYNNIEEAFSSLIDADDMLETLKKYDWHNMQDM